MYKSESGELVFIYYEKNEYSDIKICVDSDNENLNQNFQKQPTSIIIELFIKMKTG